MSEKTSQHTARNPEEKRALFWLQFKANAVKRPNGRFLALYEKRLERRIKKSLDAQKQYVVEALKDLPEFSQKGIRRIEKKSLIDNLKRLLGLMPKQEDIADDTEEIAGIVMLRAGSTTINRFKLADFGISFDLANEDAVRYMQSLRDITLSEMNGSISYTTRQEIIEAVTDGLMNGESYGEVAARIAKMGDQGVFSDARAQRIAVNETSKAYGFGSAQPLKEYRQRTGRQVWKLWVKESDACAICTENADDGWILFDEKFNSGDLTEPAHINCRCAVAYRFDDGTGSGN